MKRKFPPNRVMSAVRQLDDAERKLRAAKLVVEVSVSKFASARGYPYLRKEEAVRMARQELEGVNV